MDGGRNWLRIVSSGGIQCSGIYNNCIDTIFMLYDGAATADRANDDDDDYYYYYNDGSGNERRLPCPGFKCAFRGESNICVICGQGLEQRSVRWSVTNRPQESRRNDKVK
jgi:hypothetical protein